MSKKSALSADLSPKEIRKSAGLSLIAVAARAGVAEVTARIYELSAEGVRDERKRRALAHVYEALASDVAIGSHMATMRIA